MNEMPSQALLRAAINKPFYLQDENGSVAEVQLLAVDTGIRMDDQYVCYAAVFGLPQGTFAGQGTYRVSHPNGDAWPLFMAPIQPDATGRARLEAVFHYRASVGD